ncbi:MAG: L-threonylcarbamoyladenylate synthase [Oligoflexales bacterium]
MLENSADFCSAWEAGQICLHPTDTLPGLSVDLKNMDAVARFSKWKGRAIDKPWVHLAANEQQAFASWEPLPGGWEDYLQILWPASLSVVWHERMTGKTVCFRVPKHVPGWLQSSILQTGPLPTTSFNYAGEDPVCGWNTAAEKAKSFGFYTPLGHYNHQQKPSTVIQIVSADQYKVLRAGCVSVESIEAVVGKKGL